MEQTKPVIIIPVLNPDEKLIELVKQLHDREFQTIIIDDGSDRNIELFDLLKYKYHCDLCRHKINQGKGAALKTGIRYASLSYPDACGYVTADADGQHSAEDIAEVAHVLQKKKGKMVLGTRNFKTGHVPLKSIIGNRITSLVYFLSTGIWCADTQTGLRGIPKRLKTLCLSVTGDRYEYETNLLLEMGKKKVPFTYVPIDTIYLDNNASSHFNPVKDSFLIYYNIMKYSLSSFLSAVTDLTLFTAFSAYLFGIGPTGILASTITARLTSGALNFTLNKFWVFNSVKRSRTEALGYFLLFVCQMTASWLLVTTFSRLPANLTLIKVCVDTTLFIISYQVQKNFIFHNREERKAISG